MFGIQRMIDAAYAFYTVGYLDIPKLQIQQQYKYNEMLRQKKMKERFLYHSARKPSNMSDKDIEEFDYLTWYFEVFTKGVRRDDKASLKPRK
jgi:hypothetical protein